jgi:hypothetical protein
MLRDAIRRGQEFPVQSPAFTNVTVQSNSTYRGEPLLREERDFVRETAGKRWPFYTVYSFCKDVGGIYMNLCVTLELSNWAQV